MALLSERARELLAACRASGAIVASAESCTGGMVGAAITEIAGASEIFDRGFVTYTNAAKVEMLGVSEAILAAHGAVSEPVALEMADGALARSHARIAVSVTGIAGPGGSDFKPEGRVCFGLAQDGRKTLSQTVEFGAIGRAQVRALATKHALELLIAAANA